MLLMSESLRSVRSIISEKFLSKIIKVEKLKLNLNFLKIEVETNRYISHDREKNRLSYDVLICNPRDIKVLLHRALITGLYP